MLVPRRKIAPSSSRVNSRHPSRLIQPRSPFYSTELAALYNGEAAELLRKLPDESVDLVVTSPPYALHFQKEYGNVTKAEYVEWFRTFGEEIFRTLKPTGSFVLNIGGSYNAGTPTRSLYHFRVLLMLCDVVGFQLAQECFWYNPAKLPAPAEWVTVRRIRIKDSVEYVFWLSKTPHPNLRTHWNQTNVHPSKSTRRSPPRRQLVDSFSVGPSFLPHFVDP